MIKYLLSNKYWIILIFICYLCLYFLLLLILWPIDERYEVTCELVKIADSIFEYLFFSNSFFLSITNSLQINYFVCVFFSVLTTSIVTFLVVFSCIFIRKGSIKYIKKDELDKIKQDIESNGNV